MEREKRVLRVDGLKISRLRIQEGWSVERFCAEADLDKQTIRKLLRGEPVTISVIRSVAKVFGIRDHLELLHPDELADLGVDASATESESAVQEWEVESYLSPWEKTANGLHYHVAKLCHRFRPTRFARGKCYDLRHLPVADRRRLKDHLERHVEVCERIGRHPNVAENITATSAESGGLWWVLDKFESGTTLADRLDAGRLTAPILKHVMLGIANGLVALHAAKIVRRELSPRFVTLRQNDQRPVLTDFELAKLLDGKPTVAPQGEWPDDPFRAIEVSGHGTVDVRADVYSWGRIFVAAATGTLPAKGEEAVALKANRLPETVKACVLQCVAAPRSERPKDMAAVLKSLKRWPVDA